METRPEKFTQEQLHYWKVMAPFNTALAAELKRVGMPAGTWADPKRRLEIGRSVFVRSAQSSN
jgi:hypothetical protein